LRRKAFANKRFEFRTEQPERPDRPSLLKKQEGFLEILPLVPEIKTEKVLAVTLWTDKKQA
jgi:hypothetical protein